MGLGTAALILSGIGTVVNARAQWNAGAAERRAGEAEQRAANSMAELSEYNAAVADLMAADAEVRGELEAQRFRSRTRVLVGEQRAGFAASNVDVGYGSVLDVVEDATFLGEMDALTVRTNAQREAWGFRVEAEDSRKRAEITRREGVAAAAAGRERESGARWSALGSIATGAASLLETRYGMGKRGRG